jgi:hypothetical protein
MSEKRILRQPLLGIVLGGVLAVVTNSASLKAQVVIPSDAQASDPTRACTVSAADFDGWFETGTRSLNGVVKPADSLNFPDKPNCTFYQWAEQMFLWLTSPAVCSGNTHTFGSKEFFDVSPPDRDGNRILINHNCNLRAPPNRILNLRSAQPGPHGLPVIFDKAGRMLEVETPLTGPTGKPLVFSSAGVSEEVQDITLEKERAPIFLDKAGKPILGARPIMRHHRAPQKRTAIVQRFTGSKRPIFIDPQGKMIEVEQAQAQDSGVLMAQNNSLVYYGISVNDVFAYFLTGLKTNLITPTNPTTQQPFGQFPTTAADLAQITAFASEHAVTIPHPNALAVEIKTSWVEISPAPNHCNNKASPPPLDPSKYVTMTATVPAYDTTDCTNQWTPKGTKTVQLALVGMHVVGSTGSLCDPTKIHGGNCALNRAFTGLNGHPEMIWATFEHIGNTPLADFTYNSTTGLKTVKQNTAGTWLFSTGDSPGPFNCMHMWLENSTGNIVSANANTGSPCPASTFGTFTPSDTLRMKAWGAASDVAPNPVDRSAADSNTEIISINQSVRGMMPSGDVRSNYYLVGATWTIGGGAPLEFPATPTSPGTQVGTSMLAGSTMETYQQGEDTTAGSFGTNCFNCHNTGRLGPSAGFGFFGTPQLGTVEVSHIFDFVGPPRGSGLQPLSFAPLSIRVASLPTTTPSSFPLVKHTILVTVNDSGSGAPIAGAKVNVSDPDGIAVIASGTTSATGSVTLTYVRCSVVEYDAPPGVAANPVVVTVPCDGSVDVAGFTPVTFSAP